MNSFFMYLFQETQFKLIFSSNFIQWASSKKKQLGVQGMKFLVVSKKQHIELPGGNQKKWNFER